MGNSLQLPCSNFILILEKLQSDVDKETMEGEKTKCLKEIDEINDLIPDIEAKVSSGMGTEIRE